MTQIRKRRSNPPELRNLQTFDALQQNGSFKETALRLGVTVSAVSQSIQSLEADLGQDLFDRSKRPVSLTPFGVKYLPIAHRLNQASKEYVLACQDLVHDRQREIRIGCVDSFAATIGPMLVKSLRHQSGNVVMLSGITPQILTLLRGHEIDMAICTQPPVEATGFEIAQICEESWVLVSPVERDWPELLSFEQVRQLANTLPIVRYTQRSNIGALIDQLLAHIGINTQRRFEFDATDSVLSLVASGVGWALTSPLCLLQCEHHAKRVRISKLPPCAHKGRRFYVVYRRETTSGSITELLKIIRHVLTSQTHKHMQAINPVLSADLLTVLA